MSVTAETALQQYTLSGAGQTLPVTFYFIGAGELKVSRSVGGADAVLTNPTDYSVTGAGTNPPTGNVIMVAGTAGDVITIERSAPATQQDSFANNGPFPSTTVERDFDRLTMLIQQTWLMAKRALRIPNTNAEVAALPLNARKGQLLGFDPTTGDPTLWPMTLAPTGVAGGDLTGTYPSPKLVSRTVTNRAALRALTLLDAGKIISELGYSTAGDGGGGFWVVVRGDGTTVDNDGTLVVPGGSYGSTSTDMSLKRVMTQYANGNRNNCIMDVRWFGANVGGVFGDACVPVERAFAALLVNNTNPAGGLYFPAGSYAFTRKVALDCNGYCVDIFGDGASTQLVFAFANGTNITTNNCMLQVLNAAKGAFIGKFQITNPPVNANAPYPQSLLRFTGGGEYEVASIAFSNAMTDGNTSGITYVRNSPATQGAAGALWFESGTSITAHHITATGYGTLIYIGGAAQPSIMLHHCWLKQNSYAVTGAFANGVMGVRPTLWAETMDSAMLSDIFVENGGPYRSFTGCTITGGASFVIGGMTGHNFLAGDYVVVNGATGNTAYNHKWRIASVTANTVTIATTLAGNETGLYVTSLFAAVMLGGGVNAAGGAVAESTLKGIFTNQGGRLIEGSVGVYVCARANGAGGTYFGAGLQMEDFYSDFGESTLFIHGKPQAGYTASAIQCANIRANGGPRSPFGGVRVEIAEQVTLNGLFMQAALTAYAGASITPNPGTGNWAFTPITGVAISDGGSDNVTLFGVSDIHVGGGILQSVDQSAGIGALVSCALSVDGTRIQNIKCRGSLVDLISANSSPLVMTNGATRHGVVGGVIRELVDVDFWTGRGSTTYSTADQSIPNNAATALANFAAQALNDDGCWNAGATDRLTVVPYASRVRLNFTFSWGGGFPGAAAGAYVGIKKNGTTFVALQTANFQYGEVATPILAVVPGDYFQIIVYQNSGAPVLISGAGTTNFSLEVIK